MEKTRQAFGKAGTMVKDRKYMTFSIGEEMYGIDILKVKEIIGVPDITTVPRVPGYIKGVINLRGKIIPVVDLRLKLEFGAREYDERTCIIILEITLPEGNILLGIIVDRVQDVLNLAREQIEPAPSFGVKIDTAFITGMAKVNDLVVALLDIQQLLTAEDVNRLQSVSGPSPDTDA